MIPQVGAVAPQEPLPRTQRAEARPRQAEAAERPQAEQTEADEQERRQDFLHWMEAEVVVPIKVEAPRRPPTPSEDPRLLLAELEVPGWAPLPPADEVSGSTEKNLFQSGLTASRPLKTEGPGAAHSAPTNGDPTGEAEPLLFELEVEFEPPPALKELSIQPATAPKPLLQSAAHTDVSAPQQSGGSPEAPVMKLVEAPLLPPEVEVREYVPALKSVRVTVDRALTLEISPSDSDDSVNVRLDGTPEALRQLVNIEAELRDELPQSGYSLSEFSSHEREGEAQQQGRPGDASSPEETPGTEERQAVTHHGMIDEIA